MSQPSLAALLAAVANEGLEGWTLHDLHRMQELAHQHAEALRAVVNGRDYYGFTLEADEEQRLRAAADFLDGKAE